jgi:membrane protease YdiL (CAAX protease family)
VELCAIMVAFLAPMTLIQLAWTGTERALYAPMAALVSSVLIILVAISVRTLAFSGFTRPRARYVLEALAVTAGFLLLAHVWLAMIERAFPGATDEMGVILDRMGLPLALFVVAFCPGLFEEVAFRGIVQGRLDRLLGRVQGILVTAAAFALAHGVTPAFPIHLGIGVYLCFLRDRSGSLIPGIMLHMLYNGTLTVLG